MQSTREESSPQPKSSPSRKLCIDEILTSYVGEFGPAQFLHFSISSLAWAPEALHTLVTIFADKFPTPICSNDPQCSLSSICSLDPSEWRWSQPDSSTISSFNLVCGNEFKVGLVQALFFAGSLVGAGMFGRLADSFCGRKGALRLACLGSGICGLLTACAPSFWVYAILRFLTGLVSAGGIGLVSFVLANEPVGPLRRGPVGMSTMYFYSVGSLILALIASLTSDSWRSLYIVSSIPSLAYTFLLLPLVHESPRWLLIRGRRDDAMQVLQAFARRNSRAVPKDVTVVTEIEADSQTTSDQDLAEGAPSGTIADVLREGKLRPRLLMMILIWFSASVNYFGVLLNVSNTGFNLYTSVILNALVEMPAFAITAAFLERLGRRRMLVGAMGLSGMFCVLGGISFSLIHMPHVTSVIGLICGAVGVFGMAGAYNLLYVYMSELFPTVVRNAAMGLGSQAGEIGAIVAPVIVQMAGVNQALPFGVFGVVGLLGALLGAWLPETLNQPLYDTLEGIVDAGSKKGFEGVELLKGFEGVELLLAPV